MDYKNAVTVLDEKWFCFEEDILEFFSQLHLLKAVARKSGIHKMTAPKDSNKGDSISRLKQGFAPKQSPGVGGGPFVKNDADKQQQNTQII